jgi:hypothetical protein
MGTLFSYLSVCLFSALTAHLIKPLALVLKSVSDMGCGYLPCFCSPSLSTVFSPSYPPTSTPQHHFLLSQPSTMLAEPRGLIRSHPSKSVRAVASKTRRDTDGCLTCRVRRKKCEGSMADGSPCNACTRWHIRCPGYPGPMPSWASRNSVSLSAAACSPPSTLDPHALAPFPRSV